MTTSAYFRIKGMEIISYISVPLIAVLGTISVQKALMQGEGLVIPALIVLGANIWTTNDNTLYNAGLGLSNITKRKKRSLVIISGTTGTLASFWIYKYFVEWLMVLNTALPPIGTVIISHT